jgi:gliding motility-associated lipoprotein GldB
MSTTKLLLGFLFIIPLFYACNPDSERGPDVSGIRMDVKIRRLEQELFKLKTKEEVGVFLKANPDFAEGFLEMTGLPDDSVVVNSMYRMVTDRKLDTLYQQTQEVFSDVSGLENEFADAFKHIKYYYPNFSPPRIYTLVSGFGTDLFVSDSVIVIGLDFYLSDRGKYRPKVPAYIQKRYRPEYLVPSAVTLLSQQYNATDFLDHTLLAEMVFFGKAYEFTKQMMPSVQDSLIIGYTGKQLKDTEANQSVVWAHFLDKNLLYSTSGAVKMKYTGERPYTGEISQESPGAIGRWLGWKLVREYRAQQPEVTLPQLMQTKNAQTILTQSKYKGK